MGEALVNFLNNTFKLEVAGGIDEEKASLGEEINVVNIEESIQCM